MGNLRVPPAVISAFERYAGFLREFEGLLRSVFRFCIRMYRQVLWRREMSLITRKDVVEKREEDKLMGPKCFDSFVECLNRKSPRV